MSPIDGRRHPRGDDAGKPLVPGREETGNSGRGGCPMVIATGAALLALLIAARPGARRARLPGRAATIP